MAGNADVRSVEAIKEFRAQLVTYIAKAGAVLEEVHEEVVRMRLWLENEQRTHWQSEIRRRTRQLEESERALFRAKLSNLRDSTRGEQIMVNRAKAALGHAEEKLARVKRWALGYDDQVQPLEKGLQKLRMYLDADMPRALASLAQTVDHLEAYRSMAGPATAVADGGAGSEGAGGST